MILIVDGIFDQVFSDYIWARAVVLTSPTVATVGMSITIPLAILSDLILHAIIPSVAAVFGSILVVGGFSWLTYCSEIEEEERQEKNRGAIYEHLPQDALHPV